MDKLFSRILISTLIIIILFISSVILYQLIRFDSLKDLAETGDFLGGFLSPVLGVINISLFYYLTVLIQNNNNKLELNKTKENTKFALFNMMNSELSYFIRKMDDAFENLDEDISNTDSINKVLVTYEFLFIRMNILFPSMYQSQFNNRLRIELANADRFSTSLTPAEDWANLFNANANSKLAYANLISSMYMSNITNI